MKAAVVRHFGDSPHFDSFPNPSPTPDEVLISVRAAGLHPIVRSRADGTHYSSGDLLPLIPGVDGVGQLEDGTRVYFGLARPPYGTMAELSVTNRSMCIPLPEELDDTIAAAIFNPGMSSWLALRLRAQLAEGEHVLILGATGVAGRLAVQIAKHLGAGRVIAAGRNQQSLRSLADLGADATISLQQPDEKVATDMANELDQGGIDIILDYLWGHPTEIVISSLLGTSVTQATSRVRLIEIGAIAGQSIDLPAEVLRSSALEIYGSGGGAVGIEQIFAEFPEFMALAASGKLQINVDPTPLADVKQAWQRKPTSGHRLVFTI